MPFPLKDVRFTTRRSGDDPSAEQVLYPRLLRDRAVLPKIAIATEYFDSMVGRERRELDPEVLVQFFGDHKLARCMVACLARSYRYRGPLVEEVVTRTALKRLRRVGLDTSAALRIHLYDSVNETGNGFLRREERGPRFAEFERRLHLRPGEFERLLSLDAEEHAILIRIGAAPRAEDVVAQYNFGILETLLRHAQSIDLTLSQPNAETLAGIEHLAAANEVRVQLGHGGAGAAVRINGRQDALGSWARHGRRVARMMVQLLERGRAQVLEGQALLALRNRHVRLRMNEEALDALAGGQVPGTGWEALGGWEQLALEHVSLVSARPRTAEDARRGRAASHDRPGAPGASARAAQIRSLCSIRRQPDPQAWAAGVMVPDLLVQAGSQRALVCMVRSAAHGERLAGVARSATAGEPLVFVGAPAALSALHASGAATLALATPDPRAVVDGLYAWLTAQASETAPPAVSAA